ncbi:peroxide stress protein YaaA [Alcaligenaceae bacterium CGII-47]|nr:peroxide stress protein YaaA [Alcaligenaceae bacterium CGII-47]
MLTVLSPAKKLDYDSPVRTALYTEPIFVDQAHALIRVMRQKSVSDIAQLMKLSEPLARLNADRYAAWAPRFGLDNARQAVLAFNGDVYAGLQATELSDAQLAWAQDHLAILSGLYGVLRPLDLMQAYRLEMGTRLTTDRGANLVAFWGSTIADYLNQQLVHQGGSPVLLNLASAEYFKAVDRSVLQARVVSCVFQDYKNGVYKIINFYAKRARGLMARYIIDHRIDTPEGLFGFSAEGYAYVASESSADTLVFHRKIA